MLEPHSRSVIIRSVLLRIFPTFRSAKSGEELQGRHQTAGVLPMGVTILFVVLAAFLAWSLYAFSGAFLAAVRQRSASRNLELAQQKSQEGDLSGSLALFLKAESKWTMDADHRSHKATLADLDQYGKIAAGIASAVGREAASTHADIRATLRELKELAPNRSNFGVDDGKQQNGQTALRWNASLERLQRLRAKLRATCDPRILR